MDKLRGYTYGIMRQCQCYYSMPANTSVKGREGGKTYKDKLPERERERERLISLLAGYYITCSLLLCWAHTLPIGHPSPMEAVTDIHR